MSRNQSPSPSVRRVGTTDYLKTLSPQQLASRRREAPPPDKALVVPATTQELMACVGVTETTEVRAMAFAGHKMWAAERAGVLTVRDPATATIEGEHAFPLPNHNAFCWCVCEGPSDKTAWCGWSNAYVTVYTTEGVGAHLATLLHHKGGVCTIVSRDAFLFSASADFTIVQWDGRTRNPIRQLLGHRGGVRALATCGELLVSGGDDALVRMWDGRGAEMKSYAGHVGSVLAVAVHHRRPASRIWSGGEDSTVRVWDKITGICTIIKTPHGGRINCLSVVGSRVLSAGVDSLIVVYDPDALVILQTLDNHHIGYINGFSPPVRRIVCQLWSFSNDRSMRLWGIDAGYLWENPDDVRRVEEVDALRIQLQHVRAELNNAVRVAAMNEDKIQRDYEVKLENSLSLVRDARQVIDARASEVTQLRDQLTTEESTNQTVSRDTDVLHQLLDAQTTELVRVRCEFSDLETKYVTLFQGSERSIKELKEENKVLASSDNQRSAAVVKLLEEVGAKDSIIAALREDIREIDRERWGTAEELRNAVGEGQRLAMGSEEIRSALETARHELTVMRATSDALRLQTDSLTMENSRNLSAANDARSANAALREEHERVRMEGDTLSAENCRLRVSLEEALREGRDLVEVARNKDSVSGSVYQELTAARQEVLALEEVARHNDRAQRAAAVQSQANVDDLLATVSRLQEESKRHEYAIAAAQRAQEEADLLVQARTTHIQRLERDAVLARENAEANLESSTRHVEQQKRLVQQLKDDYSSLETQRYGDSQDALKYRVALDKRGLELEDARQVIEDRDTLYTAQRRELEGVKSELRDCQIRRDRLEFDLGHARQERDRLLNDALGYREERDSLILHSKGEVLDVQRRNKDLEDRLAVAECDATILRQRASNAATMLAAAEASKYDAHAVVEREHGQGAAMKARIAELEEENTKLKTEAPEYRAQVMAAMQRATDAELAVLAKHRGIVTLAEELKEVRASHANEVAEVLSQVAIARRENSDAGKRTEEAEALADGVRREVARLRQQAVMHRQEASDLEGQLAHKESQLAQCRSDVSALQSSSQDLEVSLDRMRRDTGEGRARLAAAEAEVLENSTKAALKQKQVAQLQAEIRAVSVEHETETAEVRAQVTQAKKSLNEALMRAQEMQQQKDAVVSELAKAKTASDNAKMHLEEALDSVRQREGMFTALRKETFDLKQSLDDAMFEKNTLSVQASKSATLLVELRVALGEAEDQRADARKDAQELRQLLAAVEKEKGEAAASVHTSATVAQIGREVAGLRMQLEDETRRADKAVMESSEFRRRLAAEGLSPSPQRQRETETGMSPQRALHVDLAPKVKELLERVDELENQLAEAHVELNVARTQKEALRQQLQEAQQSVSERDATVAKTRRELLEIRGKYEEASVANGLLETQTAKDHVTLAAQRERLEEAERNVAELRSEVSDSRRKLHAVGQAAMETNNTIQSKDRQLAHAVADAKNATARHQSDTMELTRQLQEARTSAAESRRRADECERVHDETKRKVQELATHGDNHVDIMRSAEREAVMYRKALAEAQTQIKELEGKVQEARAKGTEDDLSDITRRVEQLTTFRNTIIDLGGDLHGQLLKLSDVQSDRQDLLDQIKAGIDALALAKTQLADLTDEIDSQRVDFAQFSSDAEERRDCDEELLREETTVARAAVAEAKGLKEDLEEARRALLAAQSDLQASTNALFEATKAAAPSAKHLTPQEVAKIQQQNSVLRQECVTTRRMLEEGRTLLESAMPAVEAMERDQAPRGAVPARTGLVTALWDLYNDMASVRKVVRERSLEGEGLEGCVTAMEHAHEVGRAVIGRYLSEEEKAELGTSAFFFPGDILGGTPIAEEGMPVEGTTTGGGGSRILRLLREMLVARAAALPMDTPAAAPAPKKAPAAPPVPAAPAKRGALPVAAEPRKRPTSIVAKTAPTVAKLSIPKNPSKASPSVPESPLLVPTPQTSNVESVAAFIRSFESTSVADAPLEGGDDDTFS